MQTQFKLRTITYFVNRERGTDAQWTAELHEAAAFLRQAEFLYTSAGYEVQTLRVATRALAAVGCIEAALALAAVLERAAEAAGISFLNLGSTSDLALLTALPQLSAATLDKGFTSFSFDWQPEMGPAQARAAAAAILAMAADTGGAGNFRFGVSFNCRPEIPYFPAAKAGDRRGFAIGTENSGLLFQAFSAAAEQARVPGAGHDVLALAQRSLAAEMEAALRPVEALALELASAFSQEYLGIDASIAPALERPNLADSYEALGLGRFGGSGTLAVSAGITGVLKSLPVRLTGYCGLMLPVCEDSGLAEAADRGGLSIQSLLHFSSVCGCGLDTVPVPGPGPGTSTEEAAQLEGGIAALLLDVAALAFRLNKPLSCRLLPVPGARAGEQTAFTSPYLLNCKVMEL